MGARNRRRRGIGRVGTFSDDKKYDTQDGREASLTLDATSTQGKLGSLTRQ